MRIRAGSVVSALMSLAACAALLISNAASASPQQLAEELEVLLSGQHDLAGATLGVAVTDASTSSVIFEQAGKDPLIPASNLKLLTTGAAILTLGADFTYRTEVLLRGRDLIVVGAGDPGLGDPKLLHEADPPMLIGDLLGSIASAVADRGVTRLDGIIVDDRVFDREFTHPSWPADQLNRWYCAQVAGLNLYNNVLTVFFESSGGVGEPASYEIQPEFRPDMADWLEIANRTKTVANGSNTLWIARPRPENRFTLLGDHRRGTSVAVDVAVHEPALFTGYVLASALKDAGVTVAKADDGVASVRYPAARESFEDATPVVVIHTSLADVLTRANRDSQNLFTEALVKSVGHKVTGEPGSWINGAAVMRMLLAERLGPDEAATTSIADGSGMSRENRVAPETMALWVADMLGDDQTRPLILGSMAVPGEGTLRRRFADVELTNNVYAKSGTLSGVRCLSGCVIDRSNPHRAITFSVLINDIEGGRAIRAARNLHEQVVAAIDTWMTTTAAPATPTGRGPEFGG